MQEITVPMKLIYSGDYSQMKNALDYDYPSEASLFLLGEPYCTLQDKKVLEVFKLVLDDPRFVFDDLFVARQLYFSAPKSRNLVMKHPKFVKVVRSRKNFMDYFYERYGPYADRENVGMLQRYIQAEKAITHWEKKMQFRVLFHLYPALIKHTRKFREKYYTPGELGSLRAAEDFKSFIC